MFLKHLEAMLGTVWAALLALAILAASILVQFGIEWLLKQLDVDPSSVTIWLVSVIDTTGAVGSGVTFVLLTFLQVARLAREVRREVMSGE